jgi:hypothetical protein
MSVKLYISMSFTRQTKREELKHYSRTCACSCRLSNRGWRPPLALRLFGGARVLADASLAVDARVAGSGAVSFVVAPGFAGVRVGGLAHRSIADEHAAVFVISFCTC